MAMGDLTKSKRNEIRFGDDHFVARFTIDDRPYISGTYINPLVTLNDIIDSNYYEIVSLKREIDKMTHYEPETQRMMVWAQGHDNPQIAAKFWNNFSRLEKQLDVAVKMRQDMMMQFHDNLTRSWNDQTAQDKKFEPDDVSKSGDLVPLAGVAQSAKLITRESFKNWDWFGLGRSDIPPSFENEFLFDEIGRFFIRTHGALGAIGEVIRLLVVSPDDMGTETINEVCVANAKSGGDILFRTVLDKPVEHVVNEHFLATSSNIYLVSRR